MCVVSMIMDHYDDEWNRKYGPVKMPSPYQPDLEKTFRYWPSLPERKKSIPTQEEIDEFHRLLDRAREYDKRNNEPDCEMESKKERIRKLAEELGIADKINFL